MSAASRIPLFDWQAEPTRVVCRVATCGKKLQRRGLGWKSHAEKHVREGTAVRIDEGGLNAAYYLAPTTPVENAASQVHRAFSGAFDVMFVPAALEPVGRRWSVAGGRRP